MGIKVITPPDQLITNDELRLELRCDPDDHSEDALIDGYYAAAHSLAQHYTDRAIGEQTLELALDAFPAGAIELPRGPAVEVVSITYLDADGNVQTMDPADYSLDNYSAPSWVVAAFGTDWPATRAAANAVKVRYKAGDFPGAVKAALLVTVQFLESRPGANARPAELPPAAMALLDTVKVY